MLTDVVEEVCKALKAVARERVVWTEDFRPQCTSLSEGRLSPFVLALVVKHRGEVFDEHQRERVLSTCIVRRRC